MAISKVDDLRSIYRGKLCVICVLSLVIGTMNALESLWTHVRNKEVYTACKKG